MKDEYAKLHQALEAWRRHIVRKHPLGPQGRRAHERPTIYWRHADVLSDYREAIVRNAITKRVS